MLTKDEGQRYLRQIMLSDFGLTGQLALKNARVLIVGAGGLGCPAALYLASAGAGNIGLVDHDTVEPSNLARQVLYQTNDIGKKKAVIAAQKIRLQNPFITATAHEVLLSDENAEEIISEYDVVIDGSDNFVTRYVVNDTCVKLRKPLVYGSILNNEGQVAVFNYNGSRNLRDLFPEPPNAEDVPDCSENGVLATVPGIIGVMLANEAIKVITDKNVKTNSLAIIDLGDLTVKRILF
jgi:molybdopterin-synthase adenylyltransferase